MDPDSDRITMDFGTFYGSVDAMIRCIKTAGLNANTGNRMVEIANALGEAASTIRQARYERGRNKTEDQ